MNTLQTTTLYQTEDCQINVHFIQVNDNIEHYFESITPNGVFIDNDFLIGSVFMLRNIENIVYQLGIDLSFRSYT